MTSSVDRLRRVVSEMNATSSTEWLSNPYSGDEGWVDEEKEVKEGAEFVGERKDGGYVIDRVPRKKNGGQTELLKKKMTAFPHLPVGRNRARRSAS